MALDGQADPLARPDNSTPTDAKSPYALSGSTVPEAPFVTSREAPARLSPDVMPDPFADPLNDAAGSKTVNLEYAVSAPARHTGLDLDVAIAPRAGFAIGPEGGRLKSVGGEVRLGQRLENLVGEFQNTATWDRPAWYFFAATDGSALTWTPEMLAGAARRGLSYQEDRVVVGDHQVGISVEASGMQASFSVINRTVSNGPESRDENFVGASITMRR
jgi:hypothetical protein